jgi:hypothetical protein
MMIISLIMKYIQMDLAEDSLALQRKPHSITSQGFCTYYLCTESALVKLLDAWCPTFLLLSDLTFRRALIPKRPCPTCYFLGTLCSYSVYMLRVRQSFDFTKA